MNDQEMILKQKIEKRERFDIVLAYILIVILVVCIGILLYLKFIKKGESNIQEEYNPNYISLNDISISLNNSSLVNSYPDDVTFNSSVSGNSLIVTYVRGDININLNIPLVGNELVVTVPNDNVQIVTGIYKEIANVICVYYSNNVDGCRNALNSVTDNSIPGLRFVNNNVYIDIINSIDTENYIIYNDATKTIITNTNYTLKMLDTQITDISITNSDTDITFKGTMERLTDDSSNLSVSVKLYNLDSSLLGENKYEFKSGDKTGIFEISFMLSDTLKLSDIFSYSIEIIK